MPVFVGTSGWQYGSWRGALYPRGLPQEEWLAAYSRVPTGWRSWPRRADLDVFFNNDTHACAPGDAARFAAAIERRGFAASRAPQYVRPIAA
jgi:uncharacterized protein YecE (DUF72 family)